MATNRMKLDYNHLMEQIFDFLNNNSKEDDNLAFMLGIGLELLNSYMKNIAERALELNDEVLIDVLKDLYILTEKGGEQG